MPGLQGTLLGLQVGGVFVSCELSCDFNFTVDMLPASAVDSAGWKEFISGIRSWSVNVSGRLLAEAVGADFKTIIEYVKQRFPVYLTIGTRPSATTQMSISGYALPATGGFSGPNKGFASWQVSFQGTGEFTTSFQDYELIIDAMEPEDDWRQIVNEDVI